MTIKDVISKVKEHIQTTESNETLISYINQVEWEIYREVVLTHENPNNIEFNGYSASTPYDTELIAVPPYDDLYIKYVEAQIYLKRMENDEYNNYITMYAAALDDYKRYYTRTYRPLGLKNYRYFGV